MTRQAYTEIQVDYGGDSYHAGVTYVVHTNPAGPATIELHQVDCEVDIPAEIVTDALINHFIK
jgi:hypothetical protein